MLRPPPISTLFPYTTLFRSLPRSRLSSATKIPLAPPLMTPPAPGPTQFQPMVRSEEHTSELQSLRHLVCRLLLEKKKEPERSKGADQKSIQPKTPSTKHIAS